MDVLKVSALSKFKEGNVVLENINMQVLPFQKTAIAGATGSGKTTLLKIIAGLMQADSGEVLFRNAKVAGPDEKLIPGHPHIGYLSQHFELRNNYRVEELFEYANRLSAGKAAGLFELCRVDHLLKRRTDQLSGGEKQRIAVARLLIGRPSLLLLDEPYSNLDFFHKQLMKSVIHDIGAQLRITCIMVSHDPLDTLSWADQVIILQQGRMIQSGSPAQVYRYPTNEYAAALLGSYNVIPSPHSDARQFGSGQYAIVRPEDLKISRTSTSAQQAIVKQSLFYGSYFEVEVEWHGLSLKVKEAEGNFSAGELVYLHFQKSND